MFHTCWSEYFRNFEPINSQKIAVYQTQNKQIKESQNAAITDNKKCKLVAIIKYHNISTNTNSV